MDDHHFTVQLYQESAENGEADAQYKLGLLYLTGNGALQDFAEAAKWLKQAAEQGYALAQYELGLIYRTGYGLATGPCAELCMAESRRSRRHPGGCGGSG